MPLIHSMIYEVLIISRVMEQDLIWLESLDLILHQKKDSVTRNYSLPFTLFRSAMQGKKDAPWTEGNIDKYLKSPADYAPGN